MIIDIPNRPEKAGNKGSVRDLAYYLEKENAQKATHEKTWFFSHDRDQVGVQEVIEHIDNNKSRLKHKDAKFYLLNISPSQRELTHIQNDPATLKAYTREVMDAYAQNFQRGISGKDLLYFAKIEQTRTYKGYDHAVKAGEVQQGELKPGLQTHIHIIVSRKDKYGERQFSPLSNHRSTQKGPVRGGFNRKHFYIRSEEIFDELTGHQRRLQETFRYRNTIKFGTAREKYALQLEAQQPSPQISRGISPTVKLLASLLRNGKQEERAYHRDEERRRSASHPYEQEP